MDPYPHGRPFLDTDMPALLTAGLYHADGQILGEVYEYGSVLQSRMHRAGVTCSDCHDPHTLELRAPGNGVCSQCHLPARFDVPAHHHHAVGTEGARCVSCHMPQRTYMVVDPRRDHSFGSRAPISPSSSGRRMPARTATRTAQHRGRPPRSRHGTGRREPRSHFALALDAGRRGLPVAERRLATLASDADQPAIARATALGLLREFLTAASVPAVRRAPRPEARSCARRPSVSWRPCPRSGRSCSAGRALRSHSSRTDRGRAGIGQRQRVLSRPAERLDRAIGELIASEIASAERPEAPLDLANLYVV